MNYIHLFFLISLFIGFTSLAYKKENKLEPGFYYLAEKEEGAILIEDIGEGTTYAVDKEPAVDVKDFANVKIEHTPFDTKPLKTIRVKLTPEGRKKWRKAMDRICKTEEGIYFICNDKIYIEKRMLGQKGGLLINQSGISLCITPGHLDLVFEELRQKINPKQ